MSALEVDVILRTHNRADMLPDAVASFFAADMRGVNARLLVVMVRNACSDGTAALLPNLWRNFGAAL
jgi:glycosyltransferase involved in cell wall biosynthesis